VTESRSRTAVPVDASRYDEEWITTAWGEDNVERLLSESELAPRPRVHRAMQLCDLQPGTRLLDIASGRGEVVALAAKDGAYAVGIDYSPAIMDVARQLKQHHREREGADFSMELLQADATCLPFADGSFDRITMLDIVEHLTPVQLEAMFREVRRLLAPGGYAVVHTLPNRWVYEIGYKLARGLIRALPAQPRGEIEQQIHINEQDLPGLSDTLRTGDLNHEVWLEQHMPAQARWNLAEAHYRDNRDILYPRLAGIMGRVLDFLSHTPLKLILSNDIFGILWKEDASPCQVRTPWALTEKLCCAIGRGRGQRKQNRGG
jgi:SAM-dependent methyltransferase